MKPELAVEFGEPAERIRKAAAEWQASLIVLAVRRDKPKVGTSGGRNCLQSSPSSALPGAHGSPPLPIVGCSRSATMDRGQVSRWKSPTSFADEEDGPTPERRIPLLFARLS